MKKLKFLSIILSAMIIVVGCSEKEEKVEVKENVKEESMNLEIINLTMIKPTTINPILNNEETVSYVMHLLYDGLFTIDKDYNVVPQLVNEFGISEDGKSISIVLKDAKWHDGSDVTSSDVNFTVNLIKKNQGSPYYPLVQNISSVSVISDKELVINFKEKYPFSVDTLVFPIVSQSSLGSKSSTQLSAYENNLIGNGPYKIEKYEEREGMILSKNEEYYEDLPNAIKEVNVGIVPDEEAKVSMVMALQSDISKIGLNELSKFYEKEFEITEYEGRDYESIIFNYDNPFLKDLNFRKAIAYSIDRERIIEEAYLSDAQLANFPLNTQSKYYDKETNIITYDENKAKEYLKQAKPVENSPIEEPTVEEPETKESVEEDITTDTQSSEESKVQDNKQESIEEEKLKQEEERDEINKQISQLNLKILVNKEEAERVKAAHIISENLRDIGIKSTVEELQGEALDKAFASKEYDMVLTGWELSSVPDATGIIQSTGYMDEKLANYISSLQNVSKESQIKDIYKSIQKHVNENVAFMSLAIRDEYIVTNKRLKGQIHPNDFDVYEGCENLEVKN